MITKWDYKCKVAIISCFLFVLLSSCDKMLEVKPPATQLSTSNVFQTDASANATILGLYSELSASGFASGDNSSVTLLSGLSSDEFTNYSTDLNEVEFYANGITPVNSYLLTLWADPYKYIYYSNSIIEGLSNNSSVSPSLKTQITGEALFIRCFSYFYLVNLFGDVPLILSTNYKANTSSIRSAKEKIYDQIVSDLQTSMSMMATDYSVSSGDRSRPNKYAAEFLLSRCYLYLGKYELAKSTASDVINKSALYSLEANLSDVFVKNSKEAVWQLSPVVNSYTNEASQFILVGLPTSVALSKTLVNSFEANDKRSIQWIGTYQSIDTSYKFAYKYKSSFLSTGPSEYSMVFRLAEQYLIRAEARLMTGDFIGAVSDVNIIRHRAGLGDFDGTTQQALMQEIITQRQLEFFAEWGHRWFDLKRYKSTVNSNSLADEILPKQKSISWVPTAKLYPIPQSQIDNDPAMKGQQNPGYN